MSQTQTSSAIKSSPRQMLAWSICALAAGLLVWRAVALFTAPPQPGSSQALSPLVSAVVGAGNAQISETASGELLILLNGPVDAIDSGVAARLTEIVTTISADASAPILQQFPFAGTTVSTLTLAELTELALLAILAGLSLFGAVIGRVLRAPANPSVYGDNALSKTAAMTTAQSTAEPAPPPFDHDPYAVPLPSAHSEFGASQNAGMANERSLADAQQFAKDNPHVTAQVIEHWIRMRGFEE